MRSSRRAQDPPQRRRCHATSTPQPRSPSRGPHGPLEREPSQDSRSSAGSRSSSPRSSSARPSARRRSTRATTTPSARPQRADQILKHGGFTQSGPADRDRGRPEQAPDDRRSRIPGSDRTTCADGRSLRQTSTTCAGRMSQANRDQVSRDGRTALVEWDMSGKLKAAEKQIDPLTSAVAIGRRAAPGLLHRRGRCRQLGQGADQAVQRAARTGG